jgi:hypothetical protein
MSIKRQQGLAIVGFMVSCLLVLTASCCFERRIEDVSVERPAAGEPVGQQAVEKTFTANEFCAACHYAFGEEKLARTHQQAGIGCERCHGESERHRSDEDNVTPPEIMFPKNKINPTCMMCHPRHEIKHVPTHGVLLGGAKTIFDSDSDDDGPQITCVFCHAKKHRINLRTIRWNKATGELLED